MMIQGQILLIQTGGEGGGGRGEGAEYFVESATSRHISNTYASLDRPFVESAPTSALVQ